jgi:hypothetical protein
MQLRGCSSWCSPGVRLNEARLPGAAPVLGIARFSADPDNRLARFAVAVRGNVTGQEIGLLLIARLLEVARVENV